jgi:hypothetical protein
MARSPDSEYRDPVTHRYAYFGNFDRVCQCGHTLGVHIAGGFECGTTGDPNDPAWGCKCEKFRPTKKKRLS